MGNPKQKWTAEEEEALRAGIAKHGTGKWKNIQKDPEFNHLLYSRSNIDLKDKWRNLSVSATGQGPREKSRTPKAKANPDAPTAPSSSALPVSAPAAPIAHDASTTLVIDEKKLLDGNNAPMYNKVIMDALSTLKDPNGSDTSAIVSFIEQRYQVPQNFRGLLSSRLRRLVAQEKLEKVQNCYKIKNDDLLGAKTPTPKQKDIRARQSQSTGQVNSGETVEAAAIAAAYRIAEAENKSFVASEAVKEAERVSKMAEDSESVLQLAKEIFEKCSRGEVMLLA